MSGATEKEMLVRALHNPGRLILGPTTTTGGANYGGVLLGPHRDGEAVWRGNYSIYLDPMSKQPASVGRHGAEWPEIYCLLDGPTWDEDFLQAAFSQATSAVGLAVQDPPEARVEGTTVPFDASAWPPILFAANDPSLKSIYIPRPYPTLSLRQGVALSKRLRAGLPIRLIPSPCGDGSLPWQVARLENISL